MFGGFSMLRIVGIVYHNGDQVGFVAFNEETLLPNMIENAVLKQMLSSGIKFRNLDIESGKLKCFDMALDLLPKYDTTGKCIDSKPSFIIVAVRGADYLVMNNSFKVEPVSKPKLEKLLGLDVSYIRNAYLAKGSLCLKAKDSVPVLKAVPKYEFESEPPLVIRSEKDVDNWCEAHHITREKFNHPVVFDKNAPDIKYSACFIFKGCKSFNRPVKLLDTFVNIMGMFFGCESFNQPIEIPKSVRLMSYAFEGCKSFNQWLFYPDKCILFRAFYGTKVNLILPSYADTADKFANDETTTEDCTLYLDDKWKNKRCRTKSKIKYYSDLPSTIKMSAQKYAPVANNSVVTIARELHVTGYMPDDYVHNDYDFCYRNYIKNAVYDGVICACDHLYLAPEIVSFCSIHGILPRDFNTSVVLKPAHYPGFKFGEINGNGDWFFSDFDRFNSAIKVDSKLRILIYSFIKNCRSFNQPLEISNSGINTLVWNCDSFNSPVLLNNCTFSAEECGVHWEYWGYADSYDADKTRAKYPTFADYFKGMISDCKNFNSKLILRGTGDSNLVNDSKHTYISNRLLAIFFPFLFNKVGRFARISVENYAAVYFDGVTSNLSFHSDDDVPARLRALASYKPSLIGGPDFPWGGLSSIWLIDSNVEAFYCAIQGKDFSITFAFARNKRSFRTVFACMSDKYGNDPENPNNAGIITSFDKGFSFIFPDSWKSEIENDAKAKRFLINANVRYHSDLTAQERAFYEVDRD